VSEWPRVIVVLKTWHGPSEKIAESRLDHLGMVLDSLDKNLSYPNYRWHIADDGSDMQYVQKVMGLMGERETTFSTSGANGDIGHNLNVALRMAFRDADVVLHWSDDIVLYKEMDIRPYVTLLCDCPDVGYVSTRVIHPSLYTRLIERQKCGWHVIQPWSPNAYLMVTSLALMHRRAWDFYGPYPEGLRMDVMQEEMAWRYRRFEGGLKIVVPQELANASRVSFSTCSTWDWQLEDEHEQAPWYRYRSYSARMGHG
jgi:hypothetical protein